MHHYNYFIKDHLGNTRAVCEPDFESNTMKTKPIVHQRNDYYPFGMLHGGKDNQQQETNDNHYLYNGKEAQARKFDVAGGVYTGLNLLDYGARFYDPTIGRFTGIDPIAEKYNWVTPYNYAENSPIANIDLWGLQAFSIHNKVDNNGNESKILLLSDVNSSFKVIDENGKKMTNFKYHAFEKQMKGYSFGSGRNRNGGETDVLRTPNRVVLNSRDDKEYSNVQGEMMVDFMMRTDDTKPITYKEKEGGYLLGKDGIVSNNNILQFGEIPVDAIGNYDFDNIKVYLPTQNLRDKFKKQFKKEGYEHKFGINANNIQFITSQEKGGTKKGDETMQVIFLKLE